MVVLPLSRLPNDYYDANMSGQNPGPSQSDNSINWVRYASAAALIASGALLLSGKRRSGLFVAATGTSLALLDQQELLSRWWAVLPTYIDNFQILLNQVEGAVEEFSAQREKIGQVLGR
jgi:hypothetical protein